LGSLKFLRGLKRRSTTTNATAANPQNHDRGRRKHVEDVKSADFNRKHAVLSYSTSRSPGVTSGQAIFFVNNFSKLCLATFDADGKCVDAQGSLRWVLQEA
uniref:WD_REPEATS_REGION domain-containing protein n=1 Tax=Anisakis simplex TaxID=6269 RepID=A0A0M3JJ70_ANISI